MILSVFNWVLGALIVFVFGIYIAFSVIYLRKERKTGNAQELLVCLLGAMFLLIVLSLILLLHNQVFLSKTSNGESSTWITLITLTLSMAAIIPFAVTKALTEKEIDSMVNSAIGQKQKKIYEEIDDYMLETKGRIHKVDADESRMIGYLLLTSPNPDYLWSLSWLMRSLIYYKSVIDTQTKKGVHRDLNYVYLTQCLTFMKKDLVGLLKQTDKEISLSSFLEKYDNTIERNYDDGISVVKYTTTIFRVQHHIVSVHESLERDDYDIQGTHLDPLRRDVTMLMRWLIVEIDLFMKKQDISYETINYVNHHEIDCAKEISVVQAIHSRHKAEKDTLKTFKN